MLVLAGGAAAAVGSAGERITLRGEAAAAEGACTGAGAATYCRHSYDCKLVLYQVTNLQVPYHYANHSGTFVI